MTLVLLEGAVSELKSYLSDNMAAKLDALDTEYGDFTLDDISTWYTGAIPTALPEYPSAAVVGEEWEAEEQRSLNLLVMNTISVVIFVGDPDEATRFKKLARYARAVVELLQAGEATYGYEHWLAGPIRLSEALATEPWLQAVAIPVSLRSLESY